MNKINKISISLLIVFSCLFTNFGTVQASCGGVLTSGINNWTVASNCTISGGIYSTWGVIDVNTRTVTIANDAALVVDWQDDRITFSTGKILLVGNAAIHDANKPENGGFNPYTATSGVTNCPSGTNVWNPITNSSSSSVTYASQAGRLICK